LIEQTVPYLCLVLTGKQQARLGKQLGYGTHLRLQIIAKMQLAPTCYNAARGCSAAARFNTVTDSDVNLPVKYVCGKKNGFFTVFLLVKYDSLNSYQ